MSFIKKLAITMPTPRLVSLGQTTPSAKDRTSLVPDLQSKRKMV
jgi:hypothetical protein